jgi:hypothetical protein
MAVKKTTMSAEEKAVRDALAVVMADTGLQQAQAAISGTPFGKTQTADKLNYEDARNAVSQLSPDWQAGLGKAYAGLDTQQQKVIDQAGALGYDVNTTTGALTQKPKGLTPEEAAAAAAAADAAAKAAAAKAAADAKLSTTPTTDTKKVDQIAAISALLSSYGLGDLTGAITEAVQKGYSNDTIQLIIQDPNSKDPLAVAFQTRFSGNKARFAAGKPILSPGEYLAAERTYSQVLQSYGVGTLAKKETMSSFIAGDISAAEVADRVGLAIDRVKNADPFTKAALAEYYPSLNQTDIVSALLDPAEGLPALKRKVQIAEIGGAAKIQGLATGLTTTSGLASGYQGVTTGSLGAESLAQFGITQEEARKGYQAVAEIAPRAEFLSSISGGEDYTRLEAEQEAFLGLASAKRKRLSLTEQEQSRFAGQSGLTKASLTNTGQGQY